jgi:hypothetical protein
MGRGAWRASEPTQSADLNAPSSGSIIMPKRPEPPKPTSWNVYKIAKKAIGLGTVEAADKQVAVEKAAQEFKTEVWRLYAVARR